MSQAHDAVQRSLTGTEHLQAEFRLDCRFLTSAASGSTRSGRSQLHFRPPKRRRSWRGRTSNLEEECTELPNSKPDLQKIVESGVPIWLCRHPSTDLQRAILMGSSSGSQGKRRLRGPMWSNSSASSSDSLARSIRSKKAAGKKGSKDLPGLPLHAPPVARLHAGKV